MEANQHQAPVPPSPSQSSPQSASAAQQQQLSVGAAATADSEGANVNLDAKPKSPTKISLKNQKEILHPELEKIRTEANRSSVPFITALFNDHSLMQNSTGSFCSTDTGTMKSTDSRHSQASNHDTDTRRLSACYPTSTGTMITFHPNRPFSWHDEKFDRDTELVASGYTPGCNGTANAGGLSPSYFNNHHSEPHTLNNFKSPLPTSWTDLIDCMPGGSLSLNDYSSQITTQHMIPARLSCGGHDKNENPIPHKTLKENIGIA